MKSHSHGICSKIMRLKLRTNSIKKKIKSIRLDCGDEYNNRYESLGEQYSRLFTKFLEECGIVPQYTMLGSPIMNSIVERQNMTLKDMARNRIYLSTLTELL